MTIVASVSLPISSEVHRTVFTVQCCISHLLFYQLYITNNMECFCYKNGCAMCHSLVWYPCYYHSTRSPVITRIPYSFWGITNTHMIISRVHNIKREGECRTLERPRTNTLRKVEPVNYRKSTYFVHTL